MAKTMHFYLKTRRESEKFQDLLLSWPRETKNVTEAISRVRMIGVIVHDRFEDRHIIGRLAVIGDTTWVTIQRRCIPFKQALRELKRIATIRMTDEEEEEATCRNWFLDDDGYCSKCGKRHNIPDVPKDRERSESKGYDDSDRWVDDLMEGPIDELSKNIPGRNTKRGRVRLF